MKPVAVRTVALRRPGKPKKRAKISTKEKSKKKARVKAKPPKKTKAKAKKRVKEIAFDLIKLYAQRNR